LTYEDEMDHQFLNLDLTYMRPKDPVKEDEEESESEEAESKSINAQQLDFMMEIGKAAIVNKFNKAAEEKRKENERGENAVQPVDASKLNASNDKKVAFYALQGFNAHMERGNPYSEKQGKQPWDFDELFDMGQE